MACGDHFAGELLDFFESAIWRDGDLFETADDRRADDCPVSTTAQGFDVFGTTDPKSNRKGQIRLFFEFAQLVCQRGRKGIPFARGTSDGDAVDEPAAVGEDARDPVGGRQRRKKFDEVEVALSHEGGQVLGFVAREVGDDEARETGVAGGIEEPFRSIPKDDRIGNHRNEGRPSGTVGTAEGFKEAGEGEARLKSAGVRSLNDGTIRDGIAVGHADFDQINAGQGEAIDDLASRIEIGITSGHEGHESHLAGGAGSLENLGNGSCGHAGFHRVADYLARVSAKGENVGDEAERIEVTAR